MHPQLIFEERDRNRDQTSDRVEYIGDSVTHPKLSDRTIRNLDLTQG